MTWVYLDGAFLPEGNARINAADAGLLYGRGVFETFRARPPRPVYRLPQHLARLEAGAATLGIAVPFTAGDIAQAVKELVTRCALVDARVRLTLTAGREDRPGRCGSVLIRARPADDYPQRLYEQGASAVTATVLRNETSPLSRVKSLNCLDNLLAREAARRAGADEALLCNTRGVLAEGSATNVFIVRGGQLLTPPIEDGALPGVTREALLDLARGAGVPAVEASITPAHLAEADEAFLTNAVAGVLPLVSIDSAAIGSCGPGDLTRRLRTLYAASAT